MIPGRFNILMDLQFGSCGKGKFAAWLARMHQVKHLSCSNRPNAGHTVVIGKQKQVFKVFPSACMLERPVPVWLSAGSAFRLEQYEAERPWVKGEVHIHPQAEIVRRNDELVEVDVMTSTKQGSLGSLMRKLQRNPDNRHMCVYVDSNFSDNVHAALERQEMWLHESSQGWGLSLDHGIYPFVTVRNCGTAAALDQMGVSPRLLGDVYGIFRPYPIRIANDRGRSSGPGWVEDQTPESARQDTEISWAEVERRSGCSGLEAQEFTTVTKRLRRVFEFSMAQIQHAVRCNGVNKLILNFAQYLCHTDAGKRFPDSLSKETRKFMTKVEDACNVPIVLVGTGPDIDDVCAP